MTILMPQNITIETAENQLDNQEVSFDVALHCKQNISSKLGRLSQTFLFFSILLFYYLFSSMTPHI